MHVCHFCDSSVGGDYFRNIAAGLTRKGVRVTLVELGPGTPPEWLSDIPGTSFFSLGAAGKLSYPQSVWRLARILKNEHVDILHTHLFFSGLIGVLAKRLDRKTIIALMRHHTSVVRMLGSRLHIAADKWMAAKADHVMTVSRAARRYMVEADRIKRDDIEVVYLGFDFERLAPDTDARKRIRQEFGFADDDLVIGYVANFAPGKGHIQLIEAFTKIRSETPKARLFFAGRGMLAEVKDAAARLPDGAIVFAGWRYDIASCLNAMDLFVQPSLSEAFSQVLIEAMGCALPVIATDVGGASEVIEAGVNGVLISPDDPDAIYREVCALFDDRVQMQNIANAGRLKVREKFSADQMTDRHFELYERWLNHL